MLPFSLAEDFENVLHVRGERLQMLSCVSTSKRSQKHTARITQRMARIRQNTAHNTQHKAKCTAQSVQHIPNSTQCTVHSAHHSRAQPGRAGSAKRERTHTIRHTLLAYNIPTQYMQAGPFSPSCVDTSNVILGLVFSSGPQQQTGNVQCRRLILGGLYVRLHACTRLFIRIRNIGQKVLINKNTNKYKNTIYGCSAYMRKPLI